MTRYEAHLLLAGIRVLAHRNEMAPTPDDLAELLEKPAALVRLQLDSLKDMSVVALVQSAYDIHVEIKDHLAVEQLEDDEGPEIGEELRAFDERKKAEAEKMANLFESGESDQRRRDKHDQMGEELKNFKKNRPKNPFGDD